MSVDVRSEVVVTSGDIAQALFSKVQQDLVSQHTALVAERQRLHETLEAFAQDWLLKRLDEARFSKEWADAQNWIAYTNRFFGITVDLQPTVDGYELKEQDRRWSFVKVLLGVQRWTDTVQWTKLDPKHSFALTAEFFWDAPDEGGEYDAEVFGRTNLPLGEFADPEFCVALNEGFEQVRALEPEILRFKALIDGTKSETTGLSVHEQIQATITMQAINTVPQLQAAFNLDALAIGVKQLLLPGVVNGSS